MQCMLIHLKNSLKRKLCVRHNFAIQLIRLLHLRHFFLIEFTIEHDLSTHLCRLVYFFIILMNFGYSSCTEINWWIFLVNKQKRLTYFVG